MKFGLASAWVLGGLLAVFSTVAQAQSAVPVPAKVAPKGPPQEQSILYSSPDGSVSNALIPAAEAPQPDYLPESPAEIPVTISEPQFPGVRYALPPRIINSRNRMEDPNDPNASLQTPTSAEIMGVQTLEQIFGLPRARATNSQDQASGVTTNIDFSDSSSENASPWGQPTSDGQSSVFGSGKSTNSTSASDGFFGNSFGQSVFGQHHDSDDSAFGAPPFEQLSSSQSKSDSFAPPADAGFSADSSAFAPPKPPAADSGFSAGTIPQWSQSPFSTPKSSSEQSVPQLPSLPAYQINNYSQPATRPSWEPKPPPWATSGPQLGTMTQPKF